MPKNVVSTEIEVPKEYSSTERKAIARDIIDYIAKRTKQGRGENNQPWSGKAGQYSESYKKNVDFKQKSSKSIVNLELSGDMLTSIDTLKNSPGVIAVGIKPSDPEWGRGKGNILGTYGQDKPIPGKQRPFLNLSEKEINAILKKYPLNNDQKRAESVLSSSIASDLSKTVVKFLEKQAGADEGE